MHSLPSFDGSTGEGVYKNASDAMARAWSHSGEMQTGRSGSDPPLPCQGLLGQLSHGLTGDLAAVTVQAELSLNSCC